MQVCKAQSSYLLHCTGPQMPFVGNGNQQLNYTVIMDNAPGPSTDNAQLQLRLRPNPVFVEIQESDRVYTGSDDRITILVSQKRLVW